MWEVDLRGVDHMGVCFMGVDLMGGDIDALFTRILSTTMTQEVDLGSKTFLCF